jgi:hypothetical protein
MAARAQRRTRWRSCGCGEAQRWWCDSDGKWRRSGSCSPCMDGKTARSLTGARGRGRRRRRAATAWLDELNGDWCSSDLHVVGNGVRRGGWRRMKQLRRRWQLFFRLRPPTRSSLETMTTAAWLGMKRGHDGAYRCEKAAAREGFIDDGGAASRRPARVAAFGQGVGPGGVLYAGKWLHAAAAPESQRECSASRQCHCQAGPTCQRISEFN